MDSDLTHFVGQTLQSLNSLLSTSSERAVPAVAPLTTSESKSIRIRAARVLSHLPLTTQSTEALRRLLGDPLMKVRVEALTAFATSENPEHRALVNERLKGESFTIKAIFAFARMLQHLSHSNV